MSQSDTAPETTPAPKEQSAFSKAMLTVTETLQDGLDQIAEAISGQPASDDTVRVDFGAAGVLTGCLKLGTSYGMDGEEAVIHVPVDGGYVVLHGVPVRLIK